MSTERKKKMLEEKRAQEEKLIQHQREIQEKESEYQDQDEMIALKQMMKHLREELKERSEVDPEVMTSIQSIETIIQKTQEKGGWQIEILELLDEVTNGLKRDLESWEEDSRIQKWSNDLWAIMGELEAVHAKGADFTSYEDIHEERDETPSQENHVETHGQHVRETASIDTTDDFEMGEFVWAMKELIQDVRTMLRPIDGPRDAEQVEKCLRILRYLESEMIKAEDSGRWNSDP
jgi:hypothetical protein